MAEMELLVGKTHILGEQVLLFRLYLQMVLMDKEEMQVSQFWRRFWRLY